MSKYRPRTPQPPPPPSSGYRSLKSTDTASTAGATGTARRPESTKGPQVDDDGFVPIRPSAAPARRRGSRRTSWSKRDVVEVVSILVAVVTVVGSAVALNYKLGSVGDKVDTIGGDVTQVKEGQISDHAKLEEVRSDVIELRRDVRDLRDSPVSAPRAGKPK
jgi:hypothetical protein